MLDLQVRSDGVVLAVKAQPGARRNAIVGTHGGMLKVAVTAAPEAGKANEAIRQLLSEALHISSGSIQLVSGQTNRQKKFLVHGVTRDDVLKLVPAT